MPKMPQALRMTRVLGGDQRHLRRTQRPRADVIEIADGRATTYSGSTGTTASRIQRLPKRALIARTTGCATRRQGLGTIRLFLTSTMESPGDRLPAPTFRLSARRPVCRLRRLASSSLGELPRTPQASIDQLLQQASQSAPEQAALLRLSAADQAWRQQEHRPRHASSMKCRWTA